MGFDEKILSDVRHYCVGQADDDFFDPTLIMHVNSAFLELLELGALDDAFIISTGNETWNDIDDVHHILPFIREWVQIKVKTLFDPPKSTSQNTAYSGQLERLEYRMWSEGNYKTE